jgi:hypothetical protein
MTTPLVDLMVAPVAADILACLTVEMSKTPVPPDQVCIRVGDRVDLMISQTYDECCAGLAWLRLVQVYPSQSFPDPDTGSAPCGVLRWALVFELGAARCAPVAESGVPTCEQWQAAAVTHFADMAALRRTVCCYEREVKPDRQVVVSSGQIPQTTEGGCTAVTMQITVSARPCDPVCRESV